jgi:Na+/H+-dicarboxylate symporter/ABC-type amino acid transport substrate-binding protein
MASSVDERKDHTPPTLGTRILIGVLAGVGVGLFFGDLAAPFEALGDVYVALLQMTVLPYVVVSLISRIGRFTYDRARQVAGNGILVQLLLWGLALSAVVVLPLSLPDWQAGSFFSASLVEEPEPFDFLGLYLPTNPFGALADNIVPATVVFSILLGVAVIPLAAKARLLDPLDVVGDALANISRAVIRLSPWGTFALAAGITGEAAPGELARVAAYMSAITIGVLVLGLVLFPAVVAVLTPFSYREILGRSRGTLLTAFATGKLFAVLPMIIEDVRALLIDHGVDEDVARQASDVLVPLAYPFPNAGKILAIFFIPFAAWFIGRPLNPWDYPLLLSAGFFSFFGSPVAAVPFLLGLFRLPGDLLALFLLSGIWTARVSDVLGAMHLTSFALLTSSSQWGLLRLRTGRALALTGVAVVASFGALGLNHALVSLAVGGAPPPADRVAAMEPYFEGAAQAVATSVNEAAPAREDGETALDRIRRTGELRVGYLPNSPPFSYQNRDGLVVGLDIDLAYRLAVELGVTLRPVPYEPGTLGDAFAADHFDFAVGGIGSVIREATTYRESIPYLALHVALVVPDHRVDDFRTMDQVRRMEALRLGYVEEGILVNTGRNRIPGLQPIAIASAEDYLTDPDTDLDALLATAETGAIYSMVHPEFSVVVPEGYRVRAPVVFAVAQDDDLARVVDRFLRIKQTDGTVESLYDHWILGRQPATATPRWSVVRNVFGWGRGGGGA